MMISRSKKPGERIFNIPDQVFYSNELKQMVRTWHSCQVHNCLCLKDKPTAILELIGMYFQILFSHWCISIKCPNLLFWSVTRCRRPNNSIPGACSRAIFPIAVGCPGGSHPDSYQDSSIIPLNWIILWFLFHLIMGRIWAFRVVFFFERKHRLDLVSSRHFFPI